MSTTVHPKSQTIIKCDYMSNANTVYKDAKQLIQFLFHNQKEIYSTLQNKENAKLVILYLIQNSNKFNKFLKQCLVFLNKKNSNF